MKLYFKLLVALTFVFHAFNSNAQLVVESTLTVEELVNDVLLGDGVTASNIMFNGMPGDQVTLQAGTFNSTDSNIPINEGVIMASGNITVAVGPNNSGSQSVAPGGTPLNNDPDLTQASGQTNTNDNAIIEFDFVANSDSLRFNYVFGSEEYNEYVCGNVNDVFAFFLSGPGINGPYTNDAINIALVPGTDIPVSINTVNLGVSGANGQLATCEALDPNFADNNIYYVDNEGNADPNSTQFDGMTVVLTALADIDCGVEYHIKLAIGDAGDSAFDSAVFLEAGSFAAFGEVFVDVTPSIGGITISDPQYADVLVAGCSEFEIELTRPDGLPVDSVIVVFGGTAVEDEDYQLGVNDTLFFFPPGVDTLNFAIETLWDGVPDEDEEITIMVIFPDGCGVYDTAFASMPMVDPYALESTTEDVELFCPTEITSITALGSNGIGPYIYDWGDLGIGGTVPVDVPAGGQYYVVGISDACGFEVLLDSVLVTNSIPPPLQTSIASFVQPVCPNEPVLLEALTQGGNGEYTYLWTRGSGTAVSSDYATNVNYLFDTEIQLMVVDTCGTVVNDTTLIVYPQYDALTANFSPLTDNCPSSPVDLMGFTEGGAGANEFTWRQIEGEGEFVMSVNEQNSASIPTGGLNVYQLEVTDKCYRQGYFGVNPGNAVYADTLRIIDLSNLPNVITPNGDDKNEVLIINGVQEFEDARLEVFDRWGRLIFETDNYMAGFEGGTFDNAFDGKDLEDGTYFYIINVDSGECTQSGTIQILGSND